MQKKRIKSADAGFTLLELLVVIVILAVLAGVVTLSGFGTDRRYLLRHEAQRLVGLLSAASDDAVMNGAEYGVLVRDFDYLVLEFDPGIGEWHPYKSSRVYVLPEGMRLELATDKDASWQPKNIGEDVVPDILVLSNGEFTPFELAVKDDTADYAMKLVCDGFNLPYIVTGE